MRQPWGPEETLFDTAIRRIATSPRSVDSGSADWRKQPAASRVMPSCVDAGIQGNRVIYRGQVQRRVRDRRGVALSLGF